MIRERALKAVLVLVGLLFLAGVSKRIAASSGLGTEAGPAVSGVVGGNTRTGNVGTAIAHRCSSWLQPVVKSSESEHRCCGSIRHVNHYAHRNGRLRRHRQLYMQRVSSTRE
jgi:hypothetical protein